MIHDIAQEVEKEYGRPNISIIAQRCGCDRKTVRKYLDTSNIAAEHKKRQYASKLDEYKPYIQSRLSEYPLLSGSKIYEELQQKGFDGSYTIVKDYLRTLRGKKTPLAVYRYETKPGDQAQVDWGDLGFIQLDGENRHLYVFSIILSYSRMRFAKCTLSMDVETLIQCHIEAFQYFGGIPKEILYDNMKTVITKKTFNSKDSEYNKTFADFSSYYGFTIRTCKPYRPQDKRKN